MTWDQSIVIAGTNLTVDQAAEAIHLYQNKTKNTVDRYDFPGPGDPDELTMAEVVRTRVVKSRISDAEADWFVETAKKVPWPPPQAELRYADPAVRGGLYDDMNACYQYFWDKRQPGVVSARSARCCISSGRPPTRYSTQKSVRATATRQNVQRQSTRPLATRGCIGRRSEPTSSVIPSRAL